MDLSLCLRGGETERNADQGFRTVWDKLKNESPKSLWFTRYVFIFHFNSEFITVYRSNWPVAVSVGLS